MDFQSVLAVALVTGTAFFGMFVVIGFLFLGRQPILRKKRKSPFTVDFLRAPGMSLGIEIEELRLDALINLMMGAWIPTLLLAGAFASAYFTGKPISLGTAFVYALTIAGAIGLFGWRTYRLGRRITPLMLGYEGEVAVGQELNQLLAHQFRVYHDFPADGFNIDHIVIGPTGVFAVETKARAKPDTGDGRRDARVEFDGRKLMFPGWVETKPLAQARGQAHWLHKWIQSAVAESVPVIPVVALPGWFIDRKKNGDVLLSSGRDAEALFPRYNRSPGLDSKLVQRIAYQVEAKCRSVKPTAHKPSKKTLSQKLQSDRAL